MVDLNGVARHYRQKLNQKSYKDDPIAWATDKLNVYLWSKQQEILRSLVENKRTAVKTTHGIGKTFSAALAAAWWIDTRGAESKVVSSAPTYAQVHGLLWQEIRKFHTKAGLEGRVTQDDRWQLPYVSGGRSIDIEAGVGRKPADTNIHGFQGTHASEGVLVVLDEGCGIPETIYTGAEAITTAPMDRILVIGNPDDPNTEFGRIFRNGGEDWNLITVSAFDTPNFTGEWVPDYLRKSMPQPEQIESWKRQWGEESNRYKSKVTAEFPDTSDDGLFNRAHVEAAARAVTVEPSEHIAPRFGVDVARFGSDRTVVSKYHGGKVTIVEDWAGQDTAYTARRVGELAEEHHVADIRIDAIGVGAGVIDQLPAHVSEHVRIHSMFGNAASPDPTKWYNARAYWYDKLRETLSEGELDIPDHDVLIDEFGVIRYSIRGSAILIESKDEMKKRGIKSPDFLDSVVYASAPLDEIIDRSSGDVVDAYDLYDDLYDPFDGFIIAPI